DEGGPVRITESVLYAPVRSHPAVDGLRGDDGDGVGDVEREVRVEGDRPGSAVREQSSHLVRGELGARRHRDEPRGDRPEEDEGELRPVAHAQEDTVTRRQTETEETGRDGPHDVVDLGEGPRRLVIGPVDDDEGRPAG